MCAVSRKFCDSKIIGAQFPKSLEGEEGHDAVVSLGLGLQEEEGQIEGAGSGGQFVEEVSVDVVFAIAIPSPRGVGVGEFSRAVAAVEFFDAVVVDGKFGTMAFFSSIGRGAGFEVSSIAGDDDVVSVVSEQSEFGGMFDDAANEELIDEAIFAEIRRPAQVFHDSMDDFIDDVRMFKREFFVFL